MSSHRETRPRRNFGDLTKIADAPAVAPGTERDEGSGVIHLAALEAAERASVAAPQGSAIVAARQGSAIVAARQGSPSPSLSPVVAQAEAAPRRTSRWGPALAGGAAFAALVVGALAGSLGSTEIRAMIGDKPHPAAAAPPQGAEDEETGDDEPAAVKLPLVETLQAEPEKVAVASPVPALVEPAPAAKTALRSASTSPVAAQPAPEKRPLAAPAETAAPVVTLADRMEQAVGNDRAAQAASNDAPVPTNPDGIEPVYPSLGAINSALARPLVAAQACVEGDVPISHARVRFDATGIVGGVTVTGWAAGKPAEACVREALTKARVAPFLQASYVVPVTIRSN